MVAVSSETGRKTDLAIYGFIIILPGILFYWMLPFFSNITLGADYQLFSINEQIEMLFSIKTGSFPLYMPGYSFGHSSSALTLSQVYHPISHIASLLPGYWNGKALEWNTVLRLLSLGITQLALFTFLRKIRLNTLFAFIISLITVYNIRMLEAFRYGASLEAFTAHLLLCTAIGWYFIRPSKWLGPLSISSITYLLVCSGHPPMMFYGLLGAGVFTLIVPFFLKAMLPDIEVDLKTILVFWAKTGLYICLGILLSSAYLLPFYIEFVATNVEYAVNPNMINSVDPETPIGVLNNFFMPFVADLLTGFGGSSLILIALLLPLLRFFRIKIPSSIWVIWGILLYALLYILGSQTPVYGLAWKYFPFVASAGGLGRIAMIMPIIIMMLLAWIFKAGSFSGRVKDRHEILTPYLFLAAVALILIPLYLLPVYLLKPAFGPFTPHFIREIPFWIEFISVLFGLMALLALVLYGRYQRLTRILGFFLCLTVLLQIGTILKYGVWIEKKYDKPTFEQMLAQKKKKIDFAFHQNPSMHQKVMHNHIKRSFVEPFMGVLYTQIIPVSGQDDAYEKMEHERIPQQIFVEGYDPDKAKIITEGAQNIKEGRVDLIYSSYNSLKFRIVSPAPVVFGLSYPYTGHWSAWVNGKKTRVYRANGAANAVEIPAGESVIEFRYWSKAFFFGMLISCTTFIAIGLFACFNSLRGLRKIAGMVFIVVIGTGGFMLWYNSLYSGDNIATEYSWTYTPPQSPQNIAYGKKTSGIPLDFITSAYWDFHTSNAVDGEIEPGSGFTIYPSYDKALIIDLNQNKEINTILIYGKMKSQPLVSLSQDESNWHSISFNSAEGNHDNPSRIDLKEKELARFVRIKPLESELEIDEVEIYSDRR